jgi:GNAT superfamily N-acetyltransferase
VTRGTDLPRTATGDDALVVAELLDRFNREFRTATPGPLVLAARLERLLLGGDVVAVLAGTPAVGVALLTLRPNVWYMGPVGLLDELYVVPGERGRGIGAALLRAVEGVCCRRGGELLEINVDGEDSGARRFYERHGYSDRDPGQTQPQLYYSRDLTTPSTSSS